MDNLNEIIHIKNCRLTVALDEFLRRSCEYFNSYAQVMHFVDNSCITSDLDVQKIKIKDLIRKNAGIA